VAISGRRISPPLFESLELLGREKSLHQAQQPAYDVMTPWSGSTQRRRTASAAEPGRPRVGSW
jgi:hypothetical protein